jgi:tRNA threonylcarbamoyl adenosine modification protein (Sua5/YciO/YrdC/YwlC family)
MYQTDITSGDLEVHIESAAKSIRDGYVIVAPLEGAYVLLADAFFHDPVRALHVIRGDELGVAASVLIPSSETLEGVVREISDDAKLLTSKFWPGKLTIAMKPHTWLSWDLGDASVLDQITVRVPCEGFVHSLLTKTGPLAMASASKAGTAPLRDPALMGFTENQVADIFTEGVLEPTEISTLIESNFAGSRILRVGAISVEEIVAVVPGISLP